MVNIPLFTGFLSISGGAGFLPSTVCHKRSGAISLQESELVEEHLQVDLWDHKNLRITYILRRILETMNLHHRFHVIATNTHPALGWASPEFASELPGGRNWHISSAQVLQKCETFHRDTRPKPPTWRTPPKKNNSKCFLRTKPNRNGFSGRPTPYISLFCLTSKLPMGRGLS